MHPLLTALQLRGWTVRTFTGPRLLLPPAVAKRYPALPSEVVTFLSSLDVCCNQEENSWFLTSEDYAREESSGFRWNEYEHMGLEMYAEDPAFREGIKAFWDSHFPFMLAVHSDYDYLAMRLTPEGFGSVVHGYAPEWEEPQPIADLFGAFLQAFTIAAGMPQAENPLDVFL